MQPFQYHNQQLMCESVPLIDVADEVGTPAYVYSKSGIIDNFNTVDQAIGEYPHLICFALKANSNPDILRMMAEQGAGADVVSGGELKLALQAGFDPKRIVYAGVGKTDEEIRFAIESGILALNIESRQELDVTARIAAEVGQPAPIAIRINPDIDIEGHPYLTTGKSANKFGVELEAAREAYLWAAEQESLRIVGVHSHLGSMIKKSDPFGKSAETLIHFMLDLKKQGIEFEHLDLGGGFGVDYEHPLDSPWLVQPKDVIQDVMSVVREVGCELLFEPGRSIVGPNGALLTRVLFKKETKGKRFAVVDAGMNDMIRPSLYGAYHAILPLSQDNRETERVDVVGPICESGDFIATDRDLMRLERGDVVAVMTAGAYGYTLASNYNTRPMAVEVMVEGNRSRVIRDRQSLV